jgi:putative tricarboxylic transport membrane protein
MKRYDQIMGLIWFVLGSAIAIEALRLGVGEVRLPGIGFMPFLVGVFLGGFGFVLTLRAHLKGKEGDRLWAGQNWKKVIVTLAALFIYISLMDPLGFLVSTFLLNFVLFKVTAPKKWFSPLLTSAAVVFSCYLIFFLWLKVPLPKGILELG